MYLGFVALESPIILPALFKNAAGTPTNTDALPTYRIYGPAGLMTGGTGSMTLGDSAGLYAVSHTPRAAQGYVQGQTYTVLVAGAIAGIGKADLHTFTVI